MRLLLAEDERSLSRALTAILEGNYYAVDAVYNGKDALSYLDSGSAVFDLTTGEAEYYHRENYEKKYTFSVK